jgi:hypothetical protein
MKTSRTTGRRPGPTRRDAWRITDHLTIRPGTVLRVARGLLATAALALPSSVGFSHEDVETIAAGTFAGTSTPGAIGARERPQPGPCPDGSLPDFIQPVDIRGPDGMQIAIETASGWSPLRPAPLRMGLVVGHAYRLRVAGISGNPERELFPSVRVLAKLAAPPGMAWRFPVEIVLDEADLDAAGAGAHVRRIVYAACEPDRPDIVPANWFDVRPGDDALEVAMTLGDPVAELILGNRVPAPGAVP